VLNSKLTHTRLDNWFLNVFGKLIWRYIFLICFDLACIIIIIIIIIIICRVFRWLPLCIWLEAFAATSINAVKSSRATSRVKMDTAGRPRKFYSLMYSVYFSRTPYFFVSLQVFYRHSFLITLAYYRFYINVVTERRGRVVYSPPLRIREVPGSNLGQETGYPDSSVFMAFLSPSRWIPG
jgi:predicted neutral ceramidase superfamily lipid hydrolase